METILETSTAGCVENAIARVGQRSRISKSCRGLSQKRAGLETRPYR